jgi:isopentenyldiphosphate isomerase
VAEMLDVFTETMEWIGVRSRGEVHKEGLWHQTFQCWFVRSIEGTAYVYWQERHETKADFPGLLDITAAGHMGAGETLEEAVREIEEELGVRLTLEDLSYYGCWKSSYEREGFIDNEFCHIYYYRSELPHEAFRFQDGEVSPWS